MRRRKEGRPEIDRFKEDPRSRSIVMRQRNVLRFFFSTAAICKKEGRCQEQRAKKIFYDFLLQTSTEWNTKRHFEKYFLNAIWIVKRV